MALRVMMSSFKNWGMAMNGSRTMVRTITTATRPKPKTPEFQYTIEDLIESRMLINPGYERVRQRTITTETKRPEMEAVTIKPKNGSYLTTEEFNLVTKGADEIFNKAVEEAKKEFPDSFVDDGKGVMTIEDLIEL